MCMLGKLLMLARYRLLQFLYGRTFPAEDRRTVELLIMLIAHICGESACTVSR